MHARPHNTKQKEMEVKEIFFKAIRESLEAYDIRIYEVFNNETQVGYRIESEKIKFVFLSEGFPLKGEETAIMIYKWDGKIRLLLDEIDGPGLHYTTSEKEFTSIIAFIEQNK